ILRQTEDRLSVLVLRSHIDADKLRSRAEHRLILRERKRCHRKHTQPPHNLSPIERSQPKQGYRSPVIIRLSMDIHIAENRAQLGQAAGKAVAAALRAKIQSSGSATVAFAAAPSQNETLATLVEEPGIAWDRVTAFHLDEYVGSKPDSS